MATMTETVELQAIPQKSQRPIQLNDPGNLLGHTTNASGHNLELGSDEDAPLHAVSSKQQWNSPRRNIYRTFSTFYSFIIMGLNDAVYGAIIPYLETYYSLSYTVVSLVFLSPFLGYVAAALLNNIIHVRLGQRGVSYLGPGAHLAAYVIIGCHPPYPVLVIAFIFAGFGNGLLDAAWNAWLGNMANANEILGFLHGFYGVGATLAPTIATVLITQAHKQWYHFYLFIMVPAAGLELVLALTAFWPETADSYRKEQAAQNQGSNSKGILREALRQRVTWVASFFLLIYMGIEVGLGGWIVTFMTRERSGGEFSSGMTATGFWLGLTVGRFTLGFITPRIGENLAIAIYLAGAMAMELLFWLVPSFIISAVAVAILGFFMGPLFPAAIVAATKLLPARLHVSSIGFAAAVGGIGASAFPFAVGAIAQQAGVKVLQPFILAMIAAALALWVIGMPKMTDGKSDKMGRMTQTARKIFGRA